MIIEEIQNQDIDQLNLLQPADWDDIRPYFYYYSYSSFCEPIKISDEKRIVAVGTLIKHQDTAWLAHLIVHSEYRNQGLGKLLSNELIKRANPEIFKTIYLDATDLGYPVYKKIGFEVEMDYIHFFGNLIDLNLKNPERVIPFEEKYRNGVMELDKITSGENRELIFRDHLKSSLLYLSDGQVRGAYFPGFFDRYIMADLPEAGTELMKLRMRVKNTSKLPIKNQTGIDFLLENNYKEVRRSKRMILGLQREWKADYNYNRISGGLGLSVIWGLLSENFKLALNCPLSWLLVLGSWLSAFGFQLSALIVLDSLKSQISHHEVTYSLILSLLGSVVAPIRNSSTFLAASRPSEIAQTTRD